MIPDTGIQNLTEQIFTERLCKEECRNYADKVFEQIWCRYQKEAAGKRSFCQQAYLQNAEKMAENQSEDSEKK